MEMGGGGRRADFSKAEAHRWQAQMSEPCKARNELKLQPPKEQTRASLGMTNRF
jgi:hypothetical protein